MTAAALLAVLVVVTLTLPVGLAAARAAGLSALGLAGAWGLGLALASLLAYLLALAGATLIVAAAALFALSLAAIAALSRARRRANPPRPTVDVPALAAALGLAALALWQRPWLSHTADSFYHLGAIRSALLKNEALPTLPMYAARGPSPDPTSGGWHSLLAAASAVTGADPLALWAAVHPLAAALPLLALASFAHVASGRRSVAILAALIALLPLGGFDLRAAPYPNQVGFAALWAFLAALLLTVRRETPPPLPRPPAEGAAPSRRDADPGVLPAPDHPNHPRRDPPPEPSPAPRHVVGSVRGLPLTSSFSIEFPLSRARERGPGGEGLPAAEGPPNSREPPLPLTLTYGLLALHLAGLAALHVGLAAAALAGAALALLALALTGRWLAALRLLPTLATGAAIAALRAWPLASPATGDDRAGTPLLLPTRLVFGDPAMPGLLALARGDLGDAPSPAVLASLAALAVLAVALLAGPSLRRLAPPAPLGLPFLAAVAALPLALAAWPTPLPPPVAYALARTAQPLLPIHAVLLGWLAALSLDALVAAAASPHRAASVARAAAPAAALGLVLWTCAAAAAGHVRDDFAPAAEGRDSPDATRYSFDASRAADLSVARSDLVDALHSLPRGAVVAARPEMSYYLAGLADLFVIATPRTHTPARVEGGGWLARGDALDALDLTVDPERLASILERTGTAYVLVDSSDPAWVTWRDRPPPLLSPVGSGPSWSLLHYEPARLAAALADRFGPATPGPPPTDRPPQSTVTVAPPDPVAGEVAFVRLDTPVAAATLRLVDPSSGRVLAEAPSPPGDRPFALRLPPDAPVGRHDLLLARDGEPARPLGQLPVGREYEAESFPLPEALPRRAPDATWALYEQRFYHRHRAAWTAVAATTSRRIEPLPPGRYRLHARVYEYPTPRPNAVELRFADAAAAFEWSGGSGAPRWLTATVQSTATATTLALTATKIGQPYAIVDVIRIHPE